MDVQEWERRAEGMLKAVDPDDASSEIAYLNATLCLMMADLIRLLDKPVVNRGAR